MARYKVVSVRRRSPRLWRGTRDISKARHGRKVYHIFRTRGFY